MAALVERKNKAYGDSFDDCGKFLELLWKAGVPVEAYPDMLCFVRLFDKMKRIATDPDAFGEDPREDILGYALLNVRRKRMLQKKNPLPSFEERMFPTVKKLIGPMLATSGCQPRAARPRPKLQPRSRRRSPK